MNPGDRSISTTKLKRRCLAILDEIANSGEGFVVTRRGKPVAKIVPAAVSPCQRSLLGSVTILGDIVGTPEPWDD